MPIQTATEKISLQIAGVCYREQKLANSIKNGAAFLLLILQLDAFVLKFRTNLAKKIDSCRKLND